MEVEAVGSPVGKLRYRFCDDWFIYAEDSEGHAYYLNTELWPEWADLPEDADQEEGAIERYMLPHARPLLWRPEAWERIPDDEVREWREVVLEDLVIALDALRRERGELCCAQPEKQLIPVSIPPGIVGGYVVDCKSCGAPGPRRATPELARAAFAARFGGAHGS